MNRQTLDEIVAQHPFPDYDSWWPVGDLFAEFMSRAIGTQWTRLQGNLRNLDDVARFLKEYLVKVYKREARPSLLEDFVEGEFTTPIRSGEFDSLSYAFYRAAFEFIEQNAEQGATTAGLEKRSFTKRVGKAFFELLHDHLSLRLPNRLDRKQDFASLKHAIQQVGDFLQTQGYLRDFFDFTFVVDVEHFGKKLRQDESEFIGQLKRTGIAYALYEMGYPIILPSAVYLYNMLGEAQHHSSRIIEELFARVDCQARETDDFDPSGFPPDRIVELWEITR